MKTNHLRCRFRPRDAAGDGDHAQRALPAGGDDPESLNEISPQAGDDPEALNELETAAGGEENSQATCWQDALSLASAGQSVNYSYGDGIESLLNSEAACSQ